MKSIVIFVTGCVFGIGLMFALGIHRYSPESVVATSKVMTNAPVSQKNNNVVTVGVSPEALLEVIIKRPETVKNVLLTTTGSALELNNGITLSADSIAMQRDLADGAQKVHVAFAWE